MKVFLLAILALVGEGNASSKGAPHRVQTLQGSQCGNVSSGTGEAGKWPSFENKSTLQASPWGTYFTAVYGELPTSYPLHTLDLWMLQDSLLRASGVEVPPLVGSCPTQEGVAGERYECNNLYQKPSTSWIWHPGPFKELSGWVEIWHAASPIEQHGAWFLYTPGSGIFFDLGRTISFQEHADAFAHFHVSAVNVTSLDQLANAAADEGYDSIQFLNHKDGQWNCQQLSMTMTFGIEIVATKLSGRYACTAKKGAPAAIRAGWHASKPCQCSNGWLFRPQFDLNCKSGMRPKHPTYNEAVTLV